MAATYIDIRRESNNEAGALSGWGIASALRFSE
jgi:hypothetical protein